LNFIYVKGIQRLNICVLYHLFILQNIKSTNIETIKINIKTQRNDNDDLHSVKNRNKSISHHENLANIGKPIFLKIKKRSWL